ncbi:MAG: MerR family DNA-binding transcriptional regulator [Chromatiales bacterium]|nr:MerR family DNA-binding transcriptional regulator [Gammaproteobacteria bacterium]MBW6476835.1 MerR family DNA-binding transcriptional regulator [Chromatiales bacterium]
MEYFSIGKVSDLTGIAPVTLRAWERRYGLPRPQRTASGHRLYSSAEVALILRAQALLANGYSISRAVAQIRRSEEPNSEVHPAQALPDRWEGYRLRLFNALDRFDTPAMEASYSEALSLFPVDKVIDEVMLPVLEQLGEEWQQRDDGIAREHFFSAFLRNKIGTRFSHEISRVQGPAMVLACLPGENHEMGLMLFGLTATARNHRVLYFGADLPLEQIMPVCHKVSPQAVVLSGSSVALSETMAAQLRELTCQFSGPVYLGGELSELEAERLQGLGVIPVGKHFRHAVDAIIRKRSGHGDALVAAIR